MNRPLLPQDAARICLLSDDVLYPEAMLFVHEHARPGPRTAQVQGLLQFSGSWKDLEDFVRHQAVRGQHADVEWYQHLRDWLPTLRSRVEKDWGFLTGDESKDQRRVRVDCLCGALAREFVQHLAADLRYRAALELPQAR